MTGRTKDVFGTILLFGGLILIIIAFKDLRKEYINSKRNMSSKDKIKNSIWKIIITSILMVIFVKVFLFYRDNITFYDDDMITTLIMLVFGVIFIDGAISIIRNIVKIIKLTKQK